MQVQTTGNVMLLGVSINEYNDKVYYSAQIFDVDNGNLFDCDISKEIHAKLANANKPAPMAACIFDVKSQYQKKSRIELIGWQ